MPPKRSRLKRLLAPLKGALNLAFLTVFTLLLGIPLYILALLKRRNPTPKTDKRLANLAGFWLNTHRWLYDKTTDTEWVIDDRSALSLDKSYFVLCNHVSTVDIFALAYVFNDHIPIIRFFIKSTLRYFPVIGPVCWALDMPFMKRYSKRTLAKKPHLFGKDLDVARESLSKLKSRPVTVVNYAEGTRMTRQKHRKRQSPYEHLLRPKAGGPALTTSVLGAQLDAILNVTVIFPYGKSGYWDFVCGRTPQIIVKIEPLPVPNSFIHGDYLRDEAYKREIQQWLLDLWQAKDDLIESHVKVPNAHFT